MTGHSHMILTSSSMTQRSEQRWGDEHEHTETGFIHLNITIDI